MKIKMSCYRYAPESFRCSVDGKPFFPQDPSHFGCLLFAGRGKEAEDEIKRIVRAQRRAPRLVTIGFRSAENPRRYFFTRSLSAREDSLEERLDAFREWKKYILSRDGVVETYSVEEGDFVPGKANTASTACWHTEKVDLTKPLTVVLKGVIS